MLGLVRKILFFLDAGTRLRALGLLPLLLVSGVLESVSIALVLPLAEILLTPDRTDGWSGRLKALSGLDGFSFALVVGIGFAGMYVFKNVSILIIQYTVNRFTMTRMAAFQTDLYRHYLIRPYTSRLDENAAVIVRNVAQSAPAIFDALRTVLTIVLECILLLGAGAVVLAVVPPMATVVGAVVLGVTGFSFHAVAGPRFRRWGAQAHVATASLLKWTMQGVHSLKDIHVLGCHDYFERSFATEARALGRIRAWRQVAGLMPRAAVETVTMVGVVTGLLAIWGEKAAVEQLMAMLGVAGLAALRMIPSLNRILGLSTELRHFQTDVEHLYGELQNRSQAVAEPPETPLPFARHLRLEAITVRYQPERPAALDSVSLEVAPGEAIAVIGPSGAGKSTLLDLMLGLLRPQAGRFTVDGADALAHLPAWRANIGFVPQTIAILDDTLRANIAFAVPPAQVDPERVAKAVAMARLDDVVAGLPAGLDTRLGDGGSRLSGGQRQRVAIARALYRDPSVLIFDEATSALDDETEREIIAAIGSLKGVKTLIIVAHRLSTVRDCDRVYVLDGGRVADQGPLAEVAERHAGLKAAQAVAPLSELKETVTDA